MSRRAIALAVCIVAGLGFGASVLGPYLSLPRLDESQFPAGSAQLRGSLVWGTDAGSMYVYNGSAWTALAGNSTPNVYGDFKTGIRRCTVTSWGSTSVGMQNLGLLVSGGTAYGAFDAGAAYSSTPRITRTSVGVAQQTSFTDSASKVYWRGTGADEGGFVYWTRMALEVPTADQQLFAGLVQDFPSGPATTLSEVGPLLNTAATQSRIMFVCNPAGGVVGNSWRICAGSSRTTATCSTTAFNCVGAGAYFDLVITSSSAVSAAQPGTVTYYIKNLTTGQSETGSVPGVVPDGGILYMPTAGALYVTNGVGTFSLYSMCVTTEY